MKIENLKIALVHDRLIKWGGAELVLKIFHEMFPKAPIFTLVYDKKIANSRFANADIRPSFLQKLPYSVQAYNFYLPLMPTVVENFDLSDFDLVISICHSFAKGIVVKGKTKHICYLLTPTRFLWHQKKEALENKNLITKAILAPILSYLKKWDRKAAQRPGRIVSISKSVQERTKKYYERGSDIIHPPVEIERFTKQIQNPTAPDMPDDSRGGRESKIQNYFLIVSRLEPHKKVDLAVRAFNKLGWPLKIVGTGSELSSLKKLAKNNIEFLGELDDNKVVDYYQDCIAFIYPQEEDFGITALEAQASGKPVIAYGKGGALDTIKPGITGEFFPEQTVSSLMKALRKFKPKKYDSRKIRKWAETFSVEKFKREWMEYIKLNI